MSSETQPRLERNLVLYNRFAILSGGHFWLPVFFLFFARHFEVGEILLLQAAYYFAVVLLEVPSGYFSDRVGRVPTLRIASAAFSASFLCFVLADDVLWLYVLAQGLLATGFSFTSGTTASFHYDSLDALGRADSFDEREAALERNRFLATAGAVLVGGGLGLVDLRLPYLASFMGAVAMFAVTLAMIEPPMRDDADALADERFLDQLRTTVGYLRNPLLAWLAGYVILQLTLEHLPHSFGQPYLAHVMGEPLDDVHRTPVVIAVFVALSSLTGAGAAAVSVRLRDRYSLFSVLVGLAALQLMIVVAMGVMFHPVIAILLALRGAQPAAATVLVNITAAPLVATGHRATFLSLTSLAGRLGYSAVLVVLGSMAKALSDDATDQLRLSIWLGATIGAAGLAVVVSRAKRARIALRSR